MSADAVLVTDLDPSETCSRCSSTQNCARFRNQILCRSCLRAEDEGLLGFISPEEQKHLDDLELTLSAPWSYWRPEPQPATLLPWLCVAGLDESTDIELLVERRVGGVLCCVSGLELENHLLKRGKDQTVLDWEYSTANIEVAYCDVSDSLSCNILDVWREAEPVLDQWQREGRKVVINCVAGHNRSAAVAILWLVSKANFSLLDAAHHVQDLRGCVLSNHAFRLSLVRHAMAKSNVGQIPSKPGRWQQ